MVYLLVLFLLLDLLFVLELVVGKFLIIIMVYVFVVPSGLATVILNVFDP